MSVHRRKADLANVDHARRSRRGPAPALPPQTNHEAALVVIAEVYSGGGGKPKTVQEAQLSSKMEEVDNQKRVALALRAISKLRCRPSRLYT